MIKTLLLSCLLIVTLSLTTRSSSHLQSQFHFLDGQLCTKVGGKVCGFIQKDCCTDGCESLIFGMNEKCQGGKVLDLSTIPSCKDFCAKNNGATFKSDLLADDQCCKKQALKDGKCPAGSLIELKKCTKGTLASNIVNYVSPNSKSIV